MSDSHRGHAIRIVAGHWRYSDTGSLVSENPTRACGHCRRPNRADGHDACIGHLRGAVNACCGHGDDDSAYVQFPDVWFGGTLALKEIHRR